MTGADLWSRFVGALSNPEWLAALFAAISLILLVIANLYNLRGWWRRRSYAPEVGKFWAEGTVLVYRDAAGKLVRKVPCVYISAKVRPGSRAIHNCEVKFGPAWFGHFDSVGYDRNDVLREENLHLGRFEIDPANGAIAFQRPVHRALLLQRDGGWTGTPADFPTGALKVEVNGEVEGTLYHRELEVEIDTARLLDNVAWQAEWVGAEPRLVGDAKTALEAFVETLQAASELAQSPE